MIQQITEDKTPGIYTLEVSQSQLENLKLGIQQEQPSVVVRVLRGRKCGTVQGVFDECAAALQFPYYFGENWAALNDCLYDVTNWHPQLIVAVNSARFLLKTDERARMFFFEIFQSYIQDYAPNRGFLKLILQETGQDMEILKVWMEENEIDSTPLNLG